MRLCYSVLIKYLPGGDYNTQTPLDNFYTTWEAGRLFLNYRTCSTLCWVAQSQWVLCVGTWYCRNWLCVKHGSIKSNKKTCGHFLQVHAFTQLLTESCYLQQSNRMQWQANVPLHRYPPGGDAIGRIQEEGGGFFLQTTPQCLLN